jgi:SNF2 family DNA or RNA helicase
MANIEFVIVLTQHRLLGNIFLPYLIQKEEKFYSTVKLVKPHDFRDSDYAFKTYEKELVELTDRYSDERLMKRFSRAANVTEFYARLETFRFQKHVMPHFEQYMWEVARILMLSPVRLLNKEAKYANLYDEDEIQISPFFARPVFYFERLDSETTYRLRIFLDDKEVPLLNRNISVITNSPAVIVHRNQLIVFEKFEGKRLTPFFSKEYISVPHSMEEKYYSGFLRKTIRDFEVVAKGFQLEEGEVEKAAILKPEYNLQYEPCMGLHFRYGDETFLPNATREVAVQYKKNGDVVLFRKIMRNKEWENSILDKLQLLGLKEKSGFYLPVKGILAEQKNGLYFLINWLNRNRQKLQREGIEIGQGNLEKKYFTGEQSLVIKTGATGDWFDVYATVTFGPYSFPFVKLKNHIINDIREFELPNGEVAIIPEEWFARYKSLMPFARTREDKLQFGKHHYALLQNVLQSEEHAKMMKIKGMGNVHLPDDLNAGLRTYQREGFQWMYGLHINGFGGCLADDMGLGKTLQTLALLLKLKRQDSSSKGASTHDKNGQLDLFAISAQEQQVQRASLIVVPTSLVHNWEAEVMKFTPVLKVYRHVGQHRKTNSELENAALYYDIILTTYGTVRNDVDALSRLKFFYLILDESQYVKNPLSKTYKAVIKLQSEHRMALTGTPIENSLSDLWAQMNFLNKGLLGNLPFFQKYFLTPIEKHNSIDQEEKLQVLIRPFILRRTKDEVARDLPPLMEQVIMCEMDDDQQKSYETEKSVIRNSILAGIEQEGVKNTAMLILQGLTRLRQLANHPKLLSDVEATESGKFEEIFRMLENVVAEKHKVLVFSSFVKHLELIRKRLETENWKYSILTGKTIHRGEVIQQFQDEDDNHIFLISLKAGGVGLNLASADYVFIVDPWWNPASENQAISRAHRIGQNKHVFVYRFITKGSIEEKIQQLQSHKSSLAGKFINSNNPLQEITKDEILNLFV